LGLIGSGSLLITCAPGDVEPLRAALAAVDIEATDIGEVLDPGEGVEAYAGTDAVEWPAFQRDEVTRVSS
jgi:hydrogenase maturation factor